MATMEKVPMLAEGYERLTADLKVLLKIPEYVAGIRPVVPVLVGRIIGAVCLGA